MAGNIRPSGDGYIVGSFTVAANPLNRGEVVTITADGTVRRASATTAPIGVALTDAAVGDNVTVVRGYCLALAGAAIDVSSVSELAADSTGRLVAAGDYSTTAAHVTGAPLGDAYAVGDLFPVFVAPYLSAADHT